MIFAKFGREIDCIYLYSQAVVCCLPLALKCVSLFVCNLSNLVMFARVRSDKGARFKTAVADLRDAAGTRPLPKGPHYFVLTNSISEMQPHRHSAPLLMGLSAPLFGKSWICHWTDTLYLFTPSVCLLCVRVCMLQINWYVIIIYIG